MAPKNFRTPRGGSFVRNEFKRVESIAFTGESRHACPQRQNDSLALFQEIRRPQEEQVSDSHIPWTSHHGLSKSFHD
jgi:hypothetical protein